MTSNCEITHHPCGTDTWSSGTPCTCKTCTEYLFSQRRPLDAAVSATLNTEQELSKFVKKLAANQEPLGDEFQKVLTANLDKLYEA